MAQTQPKKKFFARIANWFRAMKSELKKVVWPNRKQTVNNSVVVLGTVVSVGIVLWVFDFVASSLVQALVTLFG